MVILGYFLSKIDSNLGQKMAKNDHGGSLKLANFNRTSAFYLRGYCINTHGNKIDLELPSSALQ